MRAALTAVLAVLALAWVCAAAPLLLVSVSRSELELEEGEVEAVAVVVANGGGYVAANTTLLIRATGCAEILGEGGWRKNISRSFGDVEPKKAHRTVLLVRCTGEDKGSLLLMAICPDCDPSVARVTITAKRTPTPLTLSYAAAAAVAITVAAIAVRRHLRSKRRGKKVIRRK